VSVACPIKGTLVACHCGTFRTVVSKIVFVFQVLCRWRYDSKPASMIVNVDYIYHVPDFDGSPFRRSDGQPIQPLEDGRRYSRFASAEAVQNPAHEINPSSSFLTSLPFSATPPTNYAQLDLLIRQFTIHYYFIAAFIGAMAASCAR